MKSGIDTHLRAFNRKERYWLLRNAIGSKFELLDREFLNSIEKSLSETGKSVEIPDDAWFAVDYHFDWIYGAIVRYSQSVATSIETRSPRSRRRVAGAENQYDILGSQEDVDLLIAFGRTIVMVEAKFEGGWAGSQISRKQTRFEDVDIFQRELLGESGSDLLQIHFMLTSRDNKKRPTNSALPWVPLKCGEGPFSRVQRCNVGNESSEDGLYWRIVGPALEEKQSIGQTGD